MNLVDLENEIKISNILDEISLNSSNLEDYILKNWDKFLNFLKFCIDNKYLNFIYKNADDNLTTTFYIHDIKFIIINNKITSVSNININIKVYSKTTKNYFEYTTEMSMKKYGMHKIIDTLFTNLIDIKK